MVGDVTLWVDRDGGGEGNSRVRVSSMLELSSCNVVIYLSLNILISARLPASFPKFLVPLGSSTMAAYCCQHETIDWT